MTTRDLPRAVIDAQMAAARRSLLTPAPAWRAPRRLAPRRGPDDVFARARAQREADDHARLVAAAARQGYALFAPLGHGGMGRVWLARTRDARGVVALKAMLPKVADDPEFRAMFLDEGRIASRIVSPHVARVVSMHEEGDILFQVMEWVDGESLFDLHRATARRRTLIPIPVVLHALAQACDGLHAAHELCDDDGSPLLVVHRDISPANVLVSAAGVVKLVDFGVAKARARIAQSTLGFALKGRVHYLAPEYVLGHAIDQRADTWSMGATLYFLLCGRPPFGASNEAAALFKVTSGEPIPKLPASVPPEVAAIAYRALERAPADRYATAAEMRDALADVASKLDARAPAALLAELVSVHESEEARARRRAAAECVEEACALATAEAAAASSAQTASEAPTLAWGLAQALSAGTRAGPWAVGGLAMLAMLALALTVRAFVAEGAPTLAARAPSEKAERSVDALDENVFEVLLPPRPAPPTWAPRPARAQESATPVDARGPIPAAISPRSPARRRYGF